MKLLNFALILCLILGCSKKPGSSDTGRTASPVVVDPVKAQDGGVDVGNKICQIPNTKVYFVAPKNWPCSEVKRTTAAESTEGSKLVIANSFASSIEASIAKLDLVSATPFTLEKYLEYKYKDSARDYKQIKINGLQGVRADIVNTNQEKKSDIYLITELKEIIHIKTQLNSNEDGFSNGEKIVSSVQVKYLGVPVKDSSPRKISLGFMEKYETLTETNCDHDHCKGVSLIYNSSELTTYNNLQLNAGTFVKLGNSKDISFDSVKAEGQYINGTGMPIKIEDFYNAFSPDSTQEKVTSITPAAGDIYLLKTKNWPEEDLISKIQIDSVNKGESLNLTVQKLIYVPTHILKEQIEIMNKNTYGNEAPLSEGEVILINSKVSQNSNYDKFNFFYSNSGNKFATKDTWDVRFESTENLLPILSSNAIYYTDIEFGNKDLQSLTKEDFPAFKIAPGFFDKSDPVPQIQTDKTYGYISMHTTREQGLTYGAVKVLQIAPDQTWVHLKFRRIYLGPIEHYQEWVPDETASYDIKSFEHEANYDYNDFYGFYADFFKFNREETESISLNDTDNNYCFYEKECGVLNLGKTIVFETIQLKDLIDFKGQYVRKTNIVQGDTIAVWREDDAIKHLAVIKIDEITKDKTINIRQRTLQKMRVK